MLLSAISLNIPFELAKVAWTLIMENKHTIWSKAKEHMHNLLQDQNNKLEIFTFDIYMMNKLRWLNHTAGAFWTL